MILANKFKLRTNKSTEHSSYLGIQIDSDWNFQKEIKSSLKKKTMRKRTYNQHVLYIIKNFYTFRNALIGVQILSPLTFQFKR